MKSFYFLCALVVIVGCREADTGTKMRADVAAGVAVANFITPPVSAANVPYVNYRFDAAKGDTMVYKTGSILLFPPNAFVDESGRVIAGEVEVRYREFRNPVDFFLAGIPMNYDSAGQSYQFVSAGMFEMLAFKNNKAVFVNPSGKPLVNLASHKDAEAYNVYYLDTVKKNWVYQEVSEPLEVKHADVAVKRFKEATENIPAALPPVQPRKPTGSRPVIRILWDAGGFEELKGYNNMRFQLDEKNEHFDARDADEIWTDVRVKARDGKELYVLEFRNARKEVTYLVRPVFEGGDYDEALRTFSQLQKQYEEIKQQRLNRLAKQRADAVKNNKTIANARARENEKITRLNALIEAKNKEIEETERKAGDIIRVYRAVQVGTLGYVNCDTYPQLQKIYVNAKYVNVKGGALSLQRGAVIAKGVNGILPMPAGERLIMIKDYESAIIGVVDGGIAFINFEEVKKRYVTQNPGTVIFPMTVLPEHDCTYEEIQRMISAL